MQTLLDSPYGTLLLTPLIHLTPYTFPTPSRRKSGTLIQLLRQVWTKILIYQKEKHSALAISLGLWQCQFPSCTAMVLLGSKLGHHHAETWKLRQCECSALHPSLVLHFILKTILPQVGRLLAKVDFCFRNRFVFALVIHFQFKKVIF